MPRSTWKPCRDAVRIAPSLLAADFGHIAKAAHDLEDSGAERIHVDVMDGVFVPNFTFGTDTVRVLRRETSLPLELHLMIVDPDAHLSTFATAGADAITVHYEACPNLHRTLDVDPRARLPLRRGDQSQHARRRCSTTFSKSCDLALVMTIDPGFGGQSLIPRTLRKVEHIRREMRTPGPGHRGRGGRRCRRDQREGVRRRRSRRARRRHRGVQAPGRAARRRRRAAQALTEDRRPA